MRYELQLITAEKMREYINEMDRAVQADEHTEQSNEQMQDLYRGYAQVRYKMVVAHTEMVQNREVRIYPMPPVETYALQHAEEFEKKIKIISLKD